MALTDVAVRKVKPGEKNARLSDEKSLYLLVQVNGSKPWCFDYKLNGRRNTMSFGSYPDVSLAQARERREQCCEKIAKGIDPVQATRQEKVERELVEADTFGRASEDHIQSLRDKNRAGATIKKHEWLLQDLARPLAKMGIRDITAADILPLLKKIEARGNRDTAHTLRATLGSVFRFCVYNLRRRQ
ncbi:tyrosine-type recombinase/integrase [Mesorhizobium sp. PUT5]|uniref:tyrosine-type recombinase/integrase n=1 Tax=Mesorhizobium sp. PUT5 TaxID=3454629 RepID=UPI003FA40907